MRRSPIRRKPPRNGRVPEEVYRLVALRSDGRCEGGLEGCTGTGQELHHRQSRSASRNPHTVGNSAFLCRSCHYLITHRSPALGRARGLVVSRHFNGDPGTLPMMVPGRGWVLLTPMGSYIPAQAPEGAEA